MTKTAVTNKKKYSNSSSDIKSNKEYQSTDIGSIASSIIGISSDEPTNLDTIENLNSYPPNNESVPQNEVSDTSRFVKIDHEVRQTEELVEPNQPPISLDRVAKTLTRQSELLNDLVTEHPQYSGLTDLSTIDQVDKVGDLARRLVLVIHGLVGKLLSSDLTAAPIQQRELPHVEVTAAWQPGTAGDKPTVKIELRTYTRQEEDMSDPLVRTAVEKLRRYKDQVKYQRARGRAAIPLEKWLQVTFIDTKKLTEDELKIVPLWAYQELDPRLAMAFHNARRYQDRKKKSSKST